jgi:hypothetical protein
MKKILLLLSVAAMWGCTDYVSQWDDKYAAAFAGGTPIQELVCAEGAVTSVSENGCTTNFVCNNNAWVPQGSVCNNVQQPVICNEGATTSVNENSCTYNYKCSNNTWTLVGQPVCSTPTVPSSSSKKVQSSSSRAVIAKSSSSKITVLNEITYTEVSGTIRCPSAMFCGPSGGDGRVKTGKDDGSDTYGYWFAYDDASNGGSSYFTWPYGKTDELTLISFTEKSIAKSNGITGVATVESNDEPGAGFLGLGFNVGGELQKGFDISAWNGLCIIYKTNAYMGLEIHPANEATVTKYDNPTATLYRPNKSTSAYVVNIPWSIFEQAGWGKAVAFSTVTKSAATISFKFTEDASFTIYALGKYGTCN